MTRSVKELLDDRAEDSAEQVFAIDPVSGISITYSELRQQARLIAEYIHQRGVAKGESVAFAMQNGTDCALVLLGILYGGFRATAINLVSGPGTMRYVLEHSETTLLFTQAEQSELLHEVFDSETKVPPQVVVDKHFWAALDSIDAIAATDSCILETDDALLMYTSGTTGVPKGVVLSQESLIAGGFNTRIAHKLEAKDRVLCVLPLYHINGLCVTLMGPIVSASSVVFPKKFSVKQFWNWVSRHQCTWFSVVPTQISYLLHEPQSDESLDLSTLRFGRSASAPLSPDVQRAFEERFGVAIVETMGLTETAAQILSNPLPPGVRKIGSPGVPVGNEVEIADEQQVPVAAGVEGEVIVRGSNVMSRYLKNEEVTAQSITAEGWLRTGDLGKKDEDGYIFITGRLKELIIKGGENIAPREVDEALYTHPNVVEAAAFAQPCAQYGQRIEAAVSLCDDACVDEEALLALCHSTLGKFKAPDKIHFLSELPKGPSGKIQRLKLCEMFAS